MENTKTKKQDHRALALNTLRFLLRSETVQATKYLDHYRIPYRTIPSDEGYWINVTWPNGITAPLTTREMEQLPDYEIHKPKKG